MSGGRMHTCEYSIRCFPVRRLSNKVKFGEKYLLFPRLAPGSTIAANLDGLKENLYEIPKRFYLVGYKTLKTKRT